MSRQSFPLVEPQLRHLYHVEMLTDGEIAARHGVDSGSVSSYRRRWGIRTLKRWERHQVRYDLPPLEGELRSLLVGSMLGDGSILPLYSAAYFTEAHCEAQKGYLEWKASLWGSWVSLFTGPRPSRLGTPQYRLATRSHGAFVPWRVLFYPLEKPEGSKIHQKVMPAVVEKEMNSFALAVWYMDDGSASSWPTISAHQRNKDVALRLASATGLTPEWQPPSSGRSSGVIVFRGYDVADAFLEQVRDHMHPDLMYKLDCGYLKSRFYGPWKALTGEYLSGCVSAGLTPQGASEGVSCGSDFVRSRAEAFGLRFEPWRYGITDAQIGELRSLGGTTTIKEMSEVVGLSRERIVSVLDRFGLPTTSVGREVPGLAGRIESGETVSGIARVEGMSRDAVLARVRSLGIAYTRPNARPGPEHPSWRRDIDEGVIRGCIGRGLSVRGMVGELGVSRELIESRLELYGLEAGPGESRGRKKKRLGAEQLRELLSKGFTRKEIGVELGVGPSIVSREMRRHSLDEEFPRASRRKRSKPMSMRDKGLKGLQSGDANPNWRHEVTEGVIRDCIARGLSVNGMVEELGVSAELIHNRLRLYGLEAGPGQKGGQKRLELDREALEELLDAGMTRKAMSSELGVSLPTLRRELKRHGLG